MEAKCQECGEVFELDLTTVGTGKSYFWDMLEDVVVIKCPNCGKRHEF